MDLWDEIKKRVVSKKYQAWGIATWFLYLGKLSEDNWLLLTFVFIGADVTEKLGLLKFMKKGGES